MAINKNERRNKEVCKFCGGEELRFQDGKELKIICLICGKDFEACRESDLHKFNEVRDSYN
jgi:hypothetical protein